MGTVGTVPSDFLKPSRRPYRPVSLPQSLSSLPSGPMLLIDAAPLPVSRSTHKRRSPKDAGRGLSRKWSKLDVPDEEEEESVVIPFPDLTPYRPGDSVPANITIQPATHPERHFSAPQRMILPPVPEVPRPKTVFYDTFSRKVHELEKGGLM